MGSRTWFKVYPNKWLKETVREDPPEIRAVWIGLLALAAAGDYSDIGEIKYNDDVALTDRQIAAALNVPIRLWGKAKKRFLQTDRIEITQNGAIQITNWTKYQSDYARQKPWRERQKAIERDPDKYIKGRYGQLVRR